MFIDTRTIQTANIQSSSSSSSSSSSTFNAGLSSSLNQVCTTIAGSSTPVAGVLDLDVAPSDVSMSNSNSAGSSADNSRRRGLVPFKRFKSKLARSEFKSREGTESEGDKLKDSEGGDRVKMRRKKGGHGEGGVGVGEDDDKNKTESSSLKTETKPLENSSSSNDSVVEGTPTTTQQEALHQQIQRIQTLLLSRLPFPSSCDSNRIPSSSTPDVPCTKKGSSSSTGVSGLETAPSSSSGSDSKQVQAASLAQAKREQDIPDTDTHSNSPTPTPTPSLNLKSKLVPDSLFKFQHQLADTKFMNFLLSVPPNSKVHAQRQEQGQDEPREKEVFTAMATDDSGDGKVENGGDTESDNIRDILDKWTRFVIPKHFGKSKAQEKEGKEKGKEEEDDGDDDGDDASLNSTSDDSSSIGISCPLEPLNEADIEIGAGAGSRLDSGYTRPWAASLKDKDKEKDESSSAFNWLFCKNHPSQENESSSPRAQSQPPRKEIRVWYPSRVKVSVEATWWGYRIYLPPPVMEILSDKSIEAAKRAALITAALSWLVSHIPLEMLPPQFKGLSLLLKEIVPLLGYIGGFIAWSWNSIRSFDKGDGVILSATWLLPIALIPGTWIHTESLSTDDDEGARLQQQQQPSQPPPPPPPPPPLPPKDVTSGVPASGTGGAAKTKETAVKFYRATIGNIGSNRQK